MVRAPGRGSFEAPTATVEPSPAEAVDAQLDSANGLVAETLAAVTPVLLATRNGMPDRDTLRKALYTWSFRTGSRMTGNPSVEAEPPAELAKAVRWVEKNTLPITALADPTLVRAALDAISKKLDGTKAADKTIARKRAVLHAALEYAVELGQFDRNPLMKVSKKAPKIAEGVDSAALPDRRRAKALLEAVGKQGKSGPRLIACFACITTRLCARPRCRRSARRTSSLRPRRAVGANSGFAGPLPP